MLMKEMGWDWGQGLFKYTYVKDISTYFTGGNLCALLHKDLRKLEKTKTKPEAKGASSVGEEGGEAELDELGLAHLHAVAEPNLGRE